MQIRGLIKRWKARKWLKKNSGPPLKYSYGKIEFTGSKMPNPYKHGQCPVTYMDPIDTTKFYEKED